MFCDTSDFGKDVYFNTLSLLFPLIGHKLNVWWLDPLGAAGLSLFIIWDWAGTCLENITRLTGEAASDQLERKVLFMAYRFAPLVEGFKSMKCYHAGDGVCVEIDILMAENTPLSRCHDVSETLQYCLEGLKEVDRAFVTIDCKDLPVPLAFESTNEDRRYFARPDRSCEQLSMQEHGVTRRINCIRAIQHGVQRARIRKNTFEG